MQPSTITSDLSFSDTQTNGIDQKVSLLQDFKKGLEVIDELVQKGKTTIVSFINAHGYNLSFKDGDYYKALQASDLLLRDGKGMEILYKAVKKDPGANFCGTDFIPLLLEKYKTKRLALIGTTAPYLKTASAELTAKGYNVVLTEHGFRPHASYVSLIEEAKPEVILIGMGNPHQEKLSYLLKQTLSFPCIIINGGAIIDYIGNKVSRAPKWMRNMGAEWLYRFMLEPKRLFNRYVKGNIVFLMRVRQLKKTFS